MELNLIHLLRLTREPAFSSNAASYYVHLPELAPFGYLHTIFIAPKEETLRQCADRLRMPEGLRRFFTFQNGADLFFNSLSLFGILEPGRLLSRTNDRIQAPFDLEDMNRQHRLPPEGEWILIGSYGFDGTQLLFHRLTEKIQAVERKHRHRVSEWADFDTYLQDEIGRLSSLFSEAGKLLVDKKYTVPGSEEIA